MKQQKIELPGKSPVAGKSAERSLPAEILNILDQGILMWSAEGTCLLFNTRVLDLLGLKADQIRIGASRAEMRSACACGGAIKAQDLSDAEAQIRANRPYSFDITHASGRTINISGRPARNGCYLETFADVTITRQAAQDLVIAKQAAESAESRTRDILETERTRQSEAKLLGQLDEWLQSCKSLKELFAIVTRFMPKLLPGSKGELYVYSNSRNALDGMCNWNTVDLHESILADSCWALRRGRSYEYEEGGLCVECEHVSAHRHEVSVPKYICIPIIAHGDTVGLLHIRFDRIAAESAHMNQSARFAIRCGEHISMAIANVKLRDELHEQSVRDRLTGLFNRRYLVEALRREISAGERRGTGFGLVAFDIDHFKTFNDNHGHDAGDVVLRTLGARIVECLGPRDIACRLGGEEFAILMPEVDLEGAVALAQRLREATPLISVRYGEAVLPKITISCGVTAYPDGGTRPQALMQLVDKALYAAKESGRDCVVRTDQLGGGRFAAGG